MKLEVFRPLERWYSWLQPGQLRLHHEVVRFVTPQEFESFAAIGAAKGFALVASSPLTRSSHHAGDDFEKLRQKRRAT